MVNYSCEIRRTKEENLQRYDELKKLFDLVKEEWPQCFDSTLGLYKLQAQIAVSWFWTDIMHNFPDSKIFPICLTNSVENKLDNEKKK